MGIDYFSCHYCGNSFPDCSYYVSCDCGYSWCSNECAKKDGYKFNKKEETSTCKYCRGEDYEDKFLLNKLLKINKMTKKQLVELIKKEAQNG